MTKILKRSPHYGQHVAHGAKGFMDFAGWEMPEHFSSLDQESKACRETAVLFDGHQMGEIHITGKDAHAAVQKVCASDIKPTPGRCFYSSLLNEKGGIVDDLVVLCLAPDHYLLTAAAFNVAKTPKWLESHVGGMDIDIDDQTSGTTIIEIQGPKSRDILQPITEADISNKALPYFRHVETKIAGIPCIIARLGVTGELGYEIIYDPGSAWAMYDAIYNAGKKHGLELCGNKTVGIFRLEKVYHIYTREIDESTNPFEAGLDPFIKLDKQIDFIGRDALMRIRDKGVDKKLVGYEIAGGLVVVAPGTPIEVNGKSGRATFAAFSPTLKKVIGLGYVPVEHASPGTKLKIKTQSATLDATIVPYPFYDPEGKRIRV
ncbi:MAG: glycine cleavage system aminomethyltransferase GcvT [Pseudomonadota bacterium]|nr:glycine cleavage system aminomethyltransferase GcvT [Pseudomonadota bacterium]